MTNEIAKAKWIDIAKLSEYKFSKMATKMVNLIITSERVKNGSVDLSKMPLGDILRENSFTKFDFNLFGKPNYFYSSEYLARIENQFKL